MYLKLSAVLAILGFVVRITAIPAALHLSPRDTSPLPPSISVVQLGLGPRLYKGASLYFPNSPEFANYTERWSASTVSDFAVVLVPAEDEDVAEAVKFANAHHLPFLATNKGHGTASALSNPHHGISIYVSALDTIVVAQDGRSALLGGGAYVAEAIQTFAAHGKASSTGACDCVGMPGPGLGGGFGRYQGYFGLVTDNIINLKVTFSWGMRGAGHNFGIVTQFNYKIHNAPVEDWTLNELVLTQDKLEVLFDQMNVLGANGKQDVRLVTYALFALDPAISTTENSHTSQPQATKTQSASPAEAKKLFPVGLLEYSIKTNRAVYNLFSKMIADHPEFNTSSVQFEGYSLQGVKAVDPASTAYAHREDNLLVSFGTFYPDPSLDEVALDYGRQARGMFHAGDAPGRPLNTYVNYASSDETREELYGYEPWRLEKLRGLKKRYDPEGKFNFYNPIG